MEPSGSADESSRRWLDQANYDLDTARSLLEAGRYVYVLFCCQQAVEKTLKARITRVSGKSPPRSHNLMHLLKVAGIELDPSGQDFLRELSAYYIQTRYPDVVDLPGEVVKGSAKKVLERTEELLRWLPSIP